MEGSGRVGGQLRGDEECPLSGVSKSGRVWRKVPESDARSAGVWICSVFLYAGKGEDKAGDVWRASRVPLR